MKVEDISAKLIGLTSNLSAVSPVDKKNLDSVRRLIGYNLQNKRQDIPVLQPTGLKFAPVKEKIQEFGKYAISRLPKEDQHLIKKIGGKNVIPAVGIRMDDIRLPINPIEALGEVRWNQKQGGRIGPFLTEAGRYIYFDLYYYEDKLTVRSLNGNVPYFLFSKARRSIWESTFKNKQSVTLKAGYIWISGRLFNNANVNDEYVGFNIKGGSFSLTNRKKWNNQYLDFEGDFTGKLTIKLVQPEKNYPSIKGGNPAQSIVFQYPYEVTFEWENGKLTGITADSGEYSDRDNQLVFKNFNPSVDYQSGLGHIFIRCQIEPNTWKSDLANSRIFFTKGQAKIKRACWALSIARVSNPDTLGEPVDNGGWGLTLSALILARWIGSDAQQPYALLNDTLLLLYPHALFLYTTNAVVDTSFANEIKQDFYCWQISAENHSRIPLSLSYQNRFLLAYYCHATDGETLLVNCSGKMQPDRPIFADGSRFFVKGVNSWVIFQAKETEISIVVLFNNQEALEYPVKPLALENVFAIVSQPLTSVLTGKLSVLSAGELPVIDISKLPIPNMVNISTLGKGKLFISGMGKLPLANYKGIEQGQITLMLGVRRWKPILPDPYVSNLKEGLNVGDVRGFFSLLFAQITWQRPDNPVITFQGSLSLLAGIAAKDPDDPIPRANPIELDQNTLWQIKKHKTQYLIKDGHKGQKTKIDDYFNESEKILRMGWHLLDVSTNMDLIGVCIFPLQAQKSKSKGRQWWEDAFTVDGMAANTQLGWVHVFTVPQVQWEPVRTLPEDQDPITLGWFPEYLGSATDGGPTRIFGLDFSYNQKLLPIIPDIVVRQIKNCFAEGNLASVWTTLSFGLKAIVMLSPQNAEQRNADSLTIVQPVFPQKHASGGILQSPWQQMKGSIQISITAESGNPEANLPLSPSPGFLGYMAQTLNGYELYTGTELALSVLGATKQSDASVETQFNAEFSKEGSKPFVPVTRFDLSGYGASNFSEWGNPLAMASIGKVQFKIMVGRTAFEVVKFVSIIYPWGITVTRTVTIERRSGGGVIRKDTGWQATRPGILDFRVPGITENKYIFCPGIFRGCFDIAKIRPASDEIIKFKDPDDNTIDVELAPVYFDAKVKIDGAENENIVSIGVLGFIQLAPKPNTSGPVWTPNLLSDEALKKLIEDQGAIGGPIDTMVNVGNSGFKLRATRFEVDVTDNVGALNFVCIIRGQPLLPNNGSWSVVKIAAPGNTTDPQEAVPADVFRGTPLFIENLWSPPSDKQMVVSGPTGPYRFADPIDLFAAQPIYDYGFMQNTGSQALLFRRPVIVSGTNEISSVLPPAFADPFAMITSKGVFPPIANAIEFPTADYKLIIGRDRDTGKLQLNTPNTPVNWNIPRAPLPIAQDGSDQIAIEYGGSDLKIVLNYDDWNVELNNFAIWTSVMGISQLSGTKFSLLAGTKQQAKLINGLSLLKPEIREILSFLPFMKDPAISLDDIDLGMTNYKKEGKIHAGFQTPNPDQWGPIKLQLSGLHGLDSEWDSDTVTWQSSWVYTLGIKFEGDIGTYTIGFELKVDFLSYPSTSPGGHPVATKSCEIKASFGWGARAKIGPFKAEAYYGAGIVFIYEDDTYKFGGFVKIGAAVDLYVVDIEISAELQGVFYRDADNTYCDVSGQVAINVSICFLIDIDATYGFKTQIQL